VCTVQQSNVQQSIVRDATAHLIVSQKASYVQLLISLPLGTAERLVLMASSILAQCCHSRFKAGLLRQASLSSRRRSMNSIMIKFFVFSSGNRCTPGITACWMGGLTAIVCLHDRCLPSPIVLRHTQVCKAAVCDACQIPSSLRHLASLAQLPFRQAGSYTSLWALADAAHPALQNAHYAAVLRVVL
jgi:hypothetical protein